MTCGVILSIGKGRGSRYMVTDDGSGRRGETRQAFMQDRYESDVCELSRRRVIQLCLNRSAGVYSLEELC